MSKFKKSIVLLVVFVLLVVPIGNSFSVSAAEFSNEDINGPTNWGDFSLFIVDYAVWRGADLYDEGTLSTLEIDNGKRLRINLISDLGNLKAGDIVELRIFLRPNNSQYTNSSKTVNGFIECGIRKDAGRIRSIAAGRGVGGSANSELAVITDVSTDWGEYYRLSFNESSLDKMYDVYGIHISYQVTGYGDSYSKYVYLQNYDFIIKTKDQYYKDGLNDVIGSHTDSLKQNQNENTDKILNGDTDLDSTGETDKVDGALGDIDGATDNAMGGKTEAEVQQEVSNALDSDKIGLDFTKANRISKFFDDTLSCFGTNYKTLLLLSLSLGLAAFLIGRRYS